MQISSLKPAELLISKSNTGSYDDKGKPSFKNILLDSLNEVNKLQLEAEQCQIRLATNKISNLHEAMIASEKANIALQFTVQIRNKIIEAYNEVMRMQI